MQAQTTWDWGPPALSARDHQQRSSWEAYSTRQITAWWSSPLGNPGLRSQSGSVNHPGGSIYQIPLRAPGACWWALGDG